MTLTTRLSWFFLSTLAVVLVAFSATLYLLADRHLHRQLDDRLESTARTLSAPCLREMLPNCCLILAEPSAPGRFHLKRSSLNELKRGIAEVAVGLEHIKCIPEIPNPICRRLGWSVEVVGANIHLADF